MSSQNSLEKNIFTIDPRQKTDLKTDIAKIKPSKYRKNPCIIGTYVQYAPLILTQFVEKVTISVYNTHPLFEFEYADYFC